MGKKNMFLCLTPKWHGQSPGWNIQARENEEPPKESEMLKG